MKAILAVCFVLFLIAVALAPAINALFKERKAKKKSQEELDRTKYAGFHTKVRFLRESTEAFGNMLSKSDPIRYLDLLDRHIRESAPHYHLVVKSSIVYSNGTKHMLVSTVIEGPWEPSSTLVYEVDNASTNATT
jgi:hypothetical protein